MAPPTPTRKALRARQKKKRRVRRSIVIGVSVLVALIVAGGAWIGVRGLMAKNELETARSMIGELKKNVADLDIPAAQATFRTIDAHAQEARHLTDDWVWRSAESVPWLGGNLRFVREIAALTSDVMIDVAGPLVSVADKIDPSKFAPKDGAIDIEPFTEAGPVLVAADTELSRLLGQARAVDADGVIGELADAKTKFVDLLDEVSPSISLAAKVIPLIPVTLGSEGPRTYVLMFQNPAESRALGGTALSFAVLKFDQGRIDLQDSFPTSTGNFVKYRSSIIPIPDGAEKVYPDLAFGTFIANATIRPSFTTAAEITQATFAKQFGMTIDGVISIDPNALSYMLRATGPINLGSGDVLTSKTLVPLLLNEVYQRFNTPNTTADNEAQDEVYGEAVDATFDRLTDGPLDSKVFLEALVQGWDERRLLYWSSHEDEESILKDLGLNGELPVSDESTVRAGVYFQDNVGAKLNYYLKTSVTLSHAVCAGGPVDYRVTVGLDSGFPASEVGNLSRSILGVWKREGLEPGVQRMFVYLYAPPGSTITGIKVNGKAISFEKLHDTDYPVGRVRISVNPGATDTITYDFTRPGSGDEKFEAQTTPLVHPTKISTEPLDCSTVPPPSS